MGESDNFEPALPLQDRVPVVGNAFQHRRKARATGALKAYAGIVTPASAQASMIDWPGSTATSMFERSSRTLKASSAPSPALRAPGLGANHSA
jgi:hypothetical protein